MKVFLKRENDFARRRQQELSRDREQWRKEFQQNKWNFVSDDNIRAAKKVLCSCDLDILND